MNLIQKKRKPGRRVTVGMKLEKDDQFFQVVKPRGTQLLFRRNLIQLEEFMSKFRAMAFANAAGKPHSSVSSDKGQSRAELYRAVVVPGMFFI